MRRRTLRRYGAALLLAAGLVATPAIASPAAADTGLPACGSDSYIAGMALRTYDNGDFKVALTPTALGRTVATWKRYHFWHMTQACVPDLDGNIADRIYAQLACHADLSLLRNREDPSGWATGATFDLESWKTPANEAHSLATGCSSDHLGYGAEHEAGEWTVYYGPHPDPAQEALDHPAPEPATDDAAASSAVGVPVAVAFTGGDGLWTHAGPGFDGELIEVLPEGTPLTLLCQVRSDMVTGWASTDLWDYVVVPDGTTAWVSDLYVETGSNDAVAGTC